jgi:putative oxidoreductase
MKKLFFYCDHHISWKASVGLLLLRVFAGLSMAFAHGLKKLPPNAGMIEFLKSLGIPFAEYAVWGAGLAEFAGGLLIVIGLATRPAAIAWAITMTVAAFIVHAADPFQKQELALMYLSVSVLFIFAGPGKISVDGMISR